MYRAAGKGSEVDAITLSHSRCPHARLPRHIDIEVVGLAICVDRSANGWPRCSDDVQEARRFEQYLPHNIGAALDAIAQKANIMSEHPCFDLIDEAPG